MNGSGNVIALDCPNAAHRNHFAMKMSGMKYPVIHGFLRDITTLHRNLQANEFAFCFDSDHLFRRELFPEYKPSKFGDGDPDKVAVRQELNILRTEVLPMLGCPNILHQRGLEADDLIAAVSLLARKWRGAKLIMVSSDKDLYQLICDRVVVWNPAKKETIDTNALVIQHGLSPSEWKLFKSLTGCDSDGVPGIPGVGPITAKKYILGALDRESKGYKEIEKSTDIIGRNSKLVELPFGVHGGIPIKMERGEWDGDAWDRVCKVWQCEVLLGKAPRN